MADLSVAEKVRVKYGLPSNPSASKIDAWAKLAREKMKTDKRRETPGREAAKTIFTSDYASEYPPKNQPTLEALLAVVGTKITVAKPRP